MAFKADQSHRFGDLWDVPYLPMCHSSWRGAYQLMLVFHFFKNITCFMSQSADQHSHSFLNGDAKTISTYSPSWRCQDVCRKTSSGSIWTEVLIQHLNACKCRFHQISWLYFTNFGLLTFFFCNTGDVYNGWSLTTFWCRKSPPIVTYVLSSLICFEKVIWNDISRKEIQLVIHGTVLLMALWIVWEIFLYQLWHSIFWLKFFPFRRSQ